MQFSSKFGIFIILVGIFLGSYGAARATSTFIVQQGGTGQTSFTSSNLLYGAGTSPIQSVATTSVSCTGSVSCSGFTVIGPSPITLSGTGLTSYDAWTHPSYGGSATTSLLTLTGGILVTASSTFSQLSTGNIYSQNGLILSMATTSSSVAYQSVWRDANQNAFAQNFVSAGTSFPTNGGTVTLTAASPRSWVFTGTNTQTVKLPNGTTLSVGATYLFNNNSTGVVTVVDNGNNVLTTILSGGSRGVVIYDTGTANGSWDSHGYLGHKVYSGYNTLSVGSSSPFSEVAIHANPTDSLAYTTLFAIGSSTSNSTTTLFSISNTGSTTAANGFNITAGCYAVGGTCLSTGGSPGGSDTQIQFNNSGSFGGSANLTWDGTKLTTVYASTTVVTAPSLFSNNIYPSSGSTIAFNASVGSLNFITTDGYRLYPDSMGSLSYLGLSSSPWEHGYINYASTTALTATSYFYSGGLAGFASTTPTYPLSVNTSGSQFAVNSSGGILSAASQPATSTAITLDWSATPPQVEYRIGTSATTITLINATTSNQWGSRKVVWVCNPGASAGAVTWAGVEWIGTAPTQTTTADQCDVYSFDVTHATSSSAYKVAGTAGTGFQ